MASSTVSAAIYLFYTNRLAFLFVLSTLVPSGLFALEVNFDRIADKIGIPLDYAGTHPSSRT